MNKLNKAFLVLAALVTITQASQTILPQDNQLDDILDSVLFGDSINLFAQGYGAGPSCNFLASGSTGSNSNGTDSDTTILLEVCGGDITIDVPDSISFGSLAVSPTEVSATSNVSFVDVNDLRGSNAGWEVSATMTNFGGLTDSNYVIQLNNGNSKFNITPDVVTVDGPNGSLNGVSEYAYTQDTTNVTDTSPTGVSNTYSIMGFSSGNGAGKFTTNIDMELLIPPYTYAQEYQATFTATVV